MKAIKINCITLNSLTAIFGLLSIAVPRWVKNERGDTIGLIQACINDNCSTYKEIGDGSSYGREIQNELAWRMELPLAMYSSGIALSIVAAILCGNKKARYFQKIFQVLSMILICIGFASCANTLRLNIDFGYNVSFGFGLAAVVSSCAAVGSSMV